MPDLDTITNIFADIAFEARVLGEESITIGTIQKHYVHQTAELRLNKTLVDSFDPPPPIKLLPTSIGKLTHLKLLDLSLQRLSYLPDELCQLTLLQTLNLDFNSIEYLPDCIGQLKQLKFLYLSFNRLSALPESITQCINVVELNLENNHITLTKDQLDWIDQLRNKGAAIYI
ncbi:MAG: leucine-rich repeat domain-containing protein [Candidatus Heimdallarchaeota archaeon]|nr:leucine-rich repeat domain-containing protein [Candidatus Heimdallarchaeota archaeon]